MPGFFNNAEDEDAEDPFPQLSDTLPLDRGEGQAGGASSVTKRRGRCFESFARCSPHSPTDERALHLDHSFSPAVSVTVNADAEPAPPLTDLAETAHARRFARELAAQLEGLRRDCDQTAGVFAQNELELAESRNAALSLEAVLTTMESEQKAVRALLAQLRAEQDALETALQRQDAQWADCPEATPHQLERRAVQLQSSLRETFRKVEDFEQLLTAELRTPGGELPAQALRALARAERALAGRGPRGV